MSFILDALKKSEMERQRQSIPGLMDTRIARRRGRLPVWAVLLGVLLGINIVVLSVVLMRNSAPMARSAPPKHVGAATAADGAAAHFSPLDSAPVYAPEIPVSAAPPAPTPPQHVAPLGIEGPPARALHRPDPVLSAEEAAPDNDEVLPSVSEINLTGAQALPELHLDVHVYATKPADRFVYINMRKYHEGAVLQEGPTIERIRRDGVVLNFHGLRFMLPRQS
jgi:general secretion pathway protein B